MAKIKAPITFSNAFSVEKSQFEELSIFNPIINVDTPLFIDPTLLKHSRYDEFSKTAIEQINIYLSKIIRLLKASTSRDDLCWRQAKKLLSKKEIQGTCLGYGANSISGRSISEKIQTQILETSKEIINKGIEDPELFFLLPLFEKGIGPDTISDLTAMIIEDTLLSFTERIAKLMKIPLTTHQYKGGERTIIKSPLIKNRITPLILLPTDILRDLPMVLSWDEISEASCFNETLRNKVNRILGRLFDANTEKEKEKERRKIFNDVDSLRKILDVIKKGTVEPYDMKNDPQGIIAWQKLLGEIEFEKRSINLDVEPSFDNIKTLVGDIVNQFKFIIEKKGLNSVLWNKDKANHEKVSQCLFFATAYSYCKAYDVDINPEMDTGIGYVDFKFSRGFTQRVIVEIKHSYNANIVRGFTAQLAGYQNAEETAFGYYVIIDVGNLGNKLNRLYDALNNDEKKKADIIYVDARIKPSASKRTTP